MGMFHLLLTQQEKEYWEEVSEKSGQPGMLEQLAQYLTLVLFTACWFSESVCLQSIKCSPGKNSSYYGNNGQDRCDGRESGSPLQGRGTKEARA